MKIFIIILFCFLLINFSSAKINEKELNKNLKETVVEEGLKQTGIINDISQGLNNSNPEAMRNLQKNCQKTEGARTLITILTIGSIIGLLTFYPVGIFGFIIDALVILNYFCWFV